MITNDLILKLHYPSLTTGKFLISAFFCFSYFISNFLVHDKNIIH